MSEKVKSGIRSWLNVVPASDSTYSIQEMVNFDTNLIRNRLWYIGDPEELSQFYRQLPGEQNKNRFWAAVSTPGREIRKIHAGIPAITVDALTNIIMTDIDSVEVPDKRKDDWKKIEKENGFKTLLETAVSECLYLGDGAFKISLDEQVSQYPIIEWYPADAIDIVYTRGRLKEVIFKSSYVYDRKEYLLYEMYGYGYVRYELHRRNSSHVIDLHTIPQTAQLCDVEFDTSLCMAVPFRIYKNPKHKERGKSIFDGKSDDYDALDEAWSQWLQALRDGRSTKYIPEELVPRNSKTGEYIRPNPFDNSFMTSSSPMVEASKSQIEIVQPNIPTDSYCQTYITALDLCLQGIISPSTIGIDVKKMDNAESQREKEKTTLYTRGKIIDALQDTIPVLIDSVFKTLDLTRNSLALEDTDAMINFGEYANPSFESQIETIGKAKTQAIMSNETVVAELYGDTKTQEWKEKEVERLNAKDGIENFTEPAINNPLEGMSADTEQKG